MYGQIGGTLLHTGKHGAVKIIEEKTESPLEKPKKKEKQKGKREGKGKAKGKEKRKEEEEKEEEKKEEKEEEREDEKEPRWLILDSSARKVIGVENGQKKKGANGAHSFVRMNDRIEYLVR